MLQFIYKGPYQLQKWLPTNLQSFQSRLTCTQNADETGFCHCAMADREQLVATILVMADILV